MTQNTNLHAILQPTATSLNPSIIDQHTTSGGAASISNDIQTYVNSGVQTIAGRGIGFTGNGLTVTEAQFQIYRSGSSSTAQLVAEIYTSTGTFGTTGCLPGTLLATSDPITQNTITTNPNIWHSFHFTGANRIVVENGVHYFLCLKCITAGLNASINVTTQRGYGQPGGDYSGGSGLGITGTISSVWANSMFLLFFRLYGVSPTYLVTYDGNGHTSGSVPTDPNSPYELNSLVTVLTSGSLVKINYMFSHWNTKADGSGVSYSPDATFAIAADAELYAIWVEDPKYTLQFNGNGNTGGFAPASQTEYVNTSVMVPNEGSLVKTNHTFSHWNTKADGSGTSYAVGSNFTFPTNTTLYAIWMENPKYTLSFNGNGHTGGSAPASQTEYVNTSTIVPNHGSLVKLNYTFSKWNTKADGTGVDYGVGSSFTFNANVTLYAVWNENQKYTLSYNGNGATSGSAPTDSNSPYYVGSFVTVMGQGTLLKTNYNFLGWSTNPSATSAQFTQGQTFPINSNTTLYAVWEEYAKYSVTYDGNGATGGDVPVDSNLYYQGTLVTVQANPGEIVKEDNTTPKIPQEVMFVFKGWAFSDSAAVPDFAVEGSLVSPSTFPMGASNVVLYAVWEKIVKYDVTYDSNGATSGYAPFDAYSPYESGSTVTVLGQGSMQKTGFLFLGWSTNSLAVSPQYLAGQKFVITQDTVLFAVWLADDLPPPSTYHVYYNSNAPVGASVLGTVPLDEALYLAGQLVSVAANPGNLASGTHNFLGWATVNNAVVPDFAVVGSVVSPSTFMMGDVDVTLFAVWQAIPLFSVVYQPNGATGGSAPVDSNLYISGGLVVVLGAGTLVRANYTFVGWNVNSSSTNVQYTPGQTFVIANSVVLYAVWSENQKYSVTYDGNGAIGGSAPVDPKSPYYAGEVVVVLNQGSLTGSLTRAGYEFLGWATSSLAVVAQYVAGDTFTIGAANVVLYAVWRYIPNTYTVLYVVNWPSGELGLGSPPVDAKLYLPGEVVFVGANPNNLSLFGYRFRGWATSSLALVPTYAVLGNTVTPPTFPMGASNVILYAVWEKLATYTVLYHGNGHTSGSAPVDSSSPYFEGSVAAVLGAGSLLKEGFVFLGWATNSSATVPQYTAGGTFIVGGNVLLFAVWKKIVHHTVTYHPNGATSGAVPSNSHQYMSGSIVTVMPNLKGLERFTFYFIGWARDPLALVADFAVEGSIVTPQSFVITSDVDLYAVWLPRPTYPVTYHANWPMAGGGTGNVPVDDGVYFDGDTVTIQANSGNLAFEGYVFIGWLCNSNLYAVENNTVRPPTVTISNAKIDFLATWSAVKPPQPDTKPVYGTVEKTKILIRATYVGDRNPPKAALMTPVLNDLLDSATDWFNGQLELHGYTLPLDPIPTLAPHLCELYAAGLFLQRETPEEKTHPYIEQAQELLVDTFGFGGDKPEPKRRPKSSRGKVSDW